MFLNDWSESGLAGVIDDFELKGDELKDAIILIASYEYEDYSGCAYVLFVKDGKLYEVHGSHCSCYGLSGYDDDGWEPEECTLEELYELINLRDDYMFRGDHTRANTLKQIERYLAGELK